MGYPNHVIVLMFENRSFDHMLGFVPGPGDLTGDESNQLDPANPDSERVVVTNTVGPITAIDPGHSFEDTAVQLFGGGGEVDPAPMSGFVADYLRYSGGNVNAARSIMECHSAETSPVLSQLATAFATCTRWFSSIPGPTWPNRFFVHAATSGGLVGNTRLDPSIWTIQDRLSAADRTWRVYAGDVPLVFTIDRLLDGFVTEAIDPLGYHHFHRLGRFMEDLTSGSLPNYSFIEPHYFETSLWNATDMHPPHDIRYGEALLSEVATSLAASDYWDDSLLLVVFDEHGGFYDKVSPPIGVLNPDGRTSVVPAFDFTRLGPRVPAVVISPFVEPGTLDPTVYDHASVPATLNRIFGLGADKFLGKRDAAANTFETNLTRTTPRPGEHLRAASLSAGPRLSEIVDLEMGVAQSITLLYRELSTPSYVLSELQQGLIDLLRSHLPHLL